MPDIQVANTKSGSSDTNWRDTATPDVATSAWFAVFARVVGLCASLAIPAG
jgi:hypothetical protein